MIGLIWAQDRNGAIGSAGAIPWHVPADMAFFRHVTTGHPTIMGRGTWESLGERPLPYRPAIVLSRASDFAPPSALAASCPSHAVRLAGEQAWIIGGGHVYRSFLSLADILAVTFIETTTQYPDTFAPVVDPGLWQVREDSGAKIDETSGLEYRIKTFARTVSTDAPDRLVYR